jgi:hypothetical protein
LDHSNKTLQSLFQVDIPDALLTGRKLESSVFNQKLHVPSLTQGQVDIADVLI